MIDEKEENAVNELLFGDMSFSDLYESLWDHRIATRYAIDCVRRAVCELEARGGLFGDDWVFFNEVLMAAEGVLRGGEVPFLKEACDFVKFLPLREEHYYVGLDSLVASALVLAFKIAVAPEEGWDPDMAMDVELTSSIVTDEHFFYDPDCMEYDWYLAEKTKRMPWYTNALRRAIREEGRVDRLGSGEE